MGKGGWESQIQHWVCNTPFDCESFEFNFWIQPNKRVIRFILPYPCLSLLLYLLSLEGERGEGEDGIVPEIRNFKKGKDRVAPEMTNKRNKVYHLKWGVTFAPGHECVLY